jgi:hypothetical protein
LPRALQGPLSARGADPAHSQFASSPARTWGAQLELSGYFEQKMIMKTAKFNHR